MSNTAKELLDILDQVGESASFCVHGSLDPVLAGLDVTGVGPVAFPIGAAEAKELIAVASQAPYGRGEETLVDTEVRRVWQLEPKQFKLTNPAWGSFIEDIVERVTIEFAIHDKVKAQLYKLLIYEKGSLFIPHRDGEKIDRMFATLVVGLPSRHKGGTLIVEHDGQTRRMDFGGKDSEFRVQYAAFYADCRHEIEPVTSGYRVCLVYNLALSGRKRRPTAPKNSAVVSQVVALLKKVFDGDEAPEKIVVPFSHQYTPAGLGPADLKGSDRAVADLLFRAAGQAGCDAYLALLERWETGEPDYESLADSYNSRRRWYDGEDDGYDAEVASMGYLCDWGMTLDKWVDSSGRSRKFGEMEVVSDEFVCDGDFDDSFLPRREELSEATGNAGMTLERWYHVVVVAIWPSKGK